MNWHLLENPFYPLGHCCLANGKGGHLIQAETIKSYTYKWDCFFQLRNWKRVAWSPFPPAAMCSDQASETQQTHRAKARAETGPADETQSPRPLIPSVSLTSLPQSQSHQQINSLFGLSWAELGFSWLEPGKWSRSVVSDSATPRTVAYQMSLSTGFSRQQYQNGLPFPSPGDLPDPQIKPGSPALQADTLPSDPTLLYANNYGNLHNWTN